MFTGRRTAFKFQQRRIEPFALGDETLMLLVKRLHPRSRSFQFCSRPGIAPGHIAAGAFELDFCTAAGTLVFQLHFIVPNHAFDQLVPREHPFPSALQLGGLLCRNLRSAPAGVCHSHYSGSMFRTEAEHLVKNFYGIRTARPWMRPLCRSWSASLAWLSLYSLVWRSTRPRSASAISSTSSG